MHHRESRPNPQLRRTIIALTTIVFAGVSSPHAADTRPSGSSVTFTSTIEGSPRTDVAVFPNLALYVPAGQPPTPFLSAGPFAAEWRGFIAVELRDNFTFQADLNGKMRLEINGEVVIDAVAKGTNVGPSKPIRLNKGPNPFMLHFDSPPEGDAYVRLEWSSREFSMEPVSFAVLSHDSSPELQRAERLRLGRELFIEHRCVKCHRLPDGANAIPELSMDAPAFEGIGSRRASEWMARWIADPKSVRPSARMPKLFHGEKAVDDANAVAAFLSSLRATNGTDAGAVPLRISALSGSPSEELLESGKSLFEKLHCVACHETSNTSGTDPIRSSLTSVRERFQPGALADFLRKPQAHFSWTRMPDFKLTVEEAAQLAGYLESASQASKDATLPGDPGLIERGRQLVQTSGCLNCHTLMLENQFKAPTLAQLSAERWRQGCVAETARDDSRAPQFVFQANEIEALRAFAQTDRSSLSRAVATEFAERESRTLNCRGCHGKFEGFPPLDLLGGKLRPEWTKAFVEGTIASKPRFWLDARMPSFPNYAGELSRGMGMLHGYPPETPVEATIDQEAATVGRRLVAAPPEGFACVQCHGVAKVGATQVFESNGINLALSAKRLLKPYYQRWVRNPLRVDPASKMPVYFDEEGRSPLTEVFGGDGAKQIEAIWQYIRLGDEMPPPPGTQAPQ